MELLLNILTVISGTYLAIALLFSTLSAIALLTISIQTHNAYPTDFRQLLIFLAIVGALWPFSLILAFTEEQE